MITKMLVHEKKACCGCTACVLKCPVHAISMNEDDEGFFYPAINPVTCIDCGLCVKTCETLSACKNTLSVAFAGYAKDNNTRKNSSSGGIFSLLAEQVFEKNGVVYGAAFDDNFKVEHIRIVNKEDLCQLQGSKYVQSSLNCIFASVLSDLKDKKMVMFSGTPCQIAGLMSYLGKDYSNLITVDVICHAVPSPKVWSKYVELMGKTAQIERISFRRKDFSWRRYAVSFLYKNDTAYLREHDKDPFMRGFLRELYNRSSCHNCRLKNNNRASDITLGDFWGIEKIAPEMDDDKGTSVVIPNTTKGMELLNDIANVTVMQSVDFGVLGTVNSALVKSTIPNRNRDKFFEMFVANPEALVDIILKNTQDPPSACVKNKIKLLLGILGLLDFARTVKSAVQHQKK